VTLFFILCQFSLADSLYAHGYYDCAATEYERVFFFYPQLKRDQPRRLRYAISLLHDDTLQGIDEFRTILDDFADLAPELKVIMAKHYIRLEHYYQAIRLLSETEEKDVLGFTYLLNGDDMNARAVFYRQHNDELVHEVDTYMGQPKKSPRTAVLLSFVCPGAGEMYAGNAGRGLIDFVLTVGSGYLFYNAMRQKKYVDAILVFNLVFHRFYLGSLYNARQAALAWNEKSRDRWLQTIEDTYFPDLDEHTPTMTPE
jgi:hypothetical protein